MVSVKPMKLRGYLNLENDGTITFESSVYNDGEHSESAKPHERVGTFTITPSEHDIELNQQFTVKRRRVEGWLNVQQESQQGDRVYITLPKPSIQHGHHMLVHEFQLMPRGATLADFGFQSKPEGETIPAPKKKAKDQDLPDE